jgi:N-acyl-L-homoserine lactone synthetase
MSFHIVQSNAEEYVSILSQIHHLRWKVFVKDLKWNYGLTSKNCMEFDNYDTESAVYIAHVDEENKVTAAMRLLKTTQPYMIKDNYSHYIFNGECPEQDDIYEITRFCSLEHQCNRRKGLSMAGHLAVAALEYGIAYSVKNYIALTNVEIKKMIERAGWDPKPMGDIHETPDGIHSVACKYTVSQEMLVRMRELHNIKENILYDVRHPEKPILDRLVKSNNLVFDMQKGAERQNSRFELCL